MSCFVPRQMPPTSEWQTKILQPHPFAEICAARRPCLGQSCPFIQTARWQAGAVLQVTLNGDAAHVMPPHLAQGAGQSFEDIADLQSRTDRRRAIARTGSMAVSRAGALKSILWQSRANRPDDAAFWSAWPAARQPAWLDRNTAG